MNIAQSVKTAGGIVQLGLVAAGVYIGYRIITAFGDMPSVTETANKGYWSSSFGDLTIKAGTAYGDYLDWYNNASGPDMSDPTGIRNGGAEYWAPKGAGTANKDSFW